MLKGGSADFVRPRPALRAGNIPCFFVYRGTESKREVASSP
ncbi:hypothetical protein HM1_0733 [Heliomicrobium modesticaldum Ice1]|uniref:Uncharacterized protein n=1 Tax=Heliobacterium modesticaldum (strain ATCC 51547 / Ice1) TaxID=498761 RepID=B0TB95_HELMI|nr:hypothetical protein HM1_0733 [Heliomicrobium modesticaldum Ice1]